jgi:aryl-alcohol dehydrogenase-like predicted oxidoreductase
VALGCNNFGGRLDVAQTRRVVDAALDSGITFFDTADVYGGLGPWKNHGGSERFLGEALQGRRDRAVVATKFGSHPDPSNPPSGSRADIRELCHASLERLGTDWIDLYYLHVPNASVEISETMGGMLELVQEGKVRAIGCCNVSAKQVAEIDRVVNEAGSVPLAAVQNRYSLLDRDDDAAVLPLCRELGVAYVPYFPLANGLLTGKYVRAQTPPEGTRLAGREIDDETFDRIDALERFATERGHTLLELAICGLASQPGIPTVIAGATKAEQARANAASGSWHLDDSELAALAALA